MAIEKVVQPYEFLARWQDGKLSGAHIQFITVVMEDGVNIGQKVGDVMPVDIGQGKGFPLADIISQLHVDALAAVDAAKAETEAKQVELDAMTEQLGAATAQLSAATAQVTTLQKQVESATISADPVSLN